MNKENVSIEIEQIYNFIAQYPDIEKISNIDRVILYLKEYHNYLCHIDMDCKEKLVIRLYKKKKSIYISKIPNFFDKSIFIKWLNHLL